MTDKEAMKLALFALDIVKIHYTQSRHINEAITALKERLTQPPQRTWIDLTDEEMMECDMDEDGFVNARPQAKLNVQAKLKEKNT